jgi:hypothetical protein
VYAGAAREAVFTNPAVIRRINADFIPLALRAPTVNGPKAASADERWLYERVNHAKIAPQGICILNSAGQVLAWAQMFDDDQSVLGFLDYAAKRSREKADPRDLVVTEQFMKYPSDKVKELRDEKKLPITIPAEHAKGTICSGSGGKGKVVPGSLVARIVGRALDDKGKPVADTVKQENYIEDQVGVSPGVQQALLKALAGAGDQRGRLPEDFSRTCASHAHLGHLDVQPCFCMIKGRAENNGEWKRCELWARKFRGNVWRIEGHSEVVSDIGITGKGVHNVKLAWEGFLEIKGERVERLILSGRGTEKLQYTNNDNTLARDKKDEVSVLPAGRAVDINCGVRYGIIATGEVAAGATTENTADDDDGEIPEEVRRQIAEALGGAFLVFRNKAMDELKLSNDQREKLRTALRGHVKATMKTFEKLPELKPEEREKTMHEHRRKSEEQLGELLKDVLTEKQRERLFQLQLQQAGAFALLGENPAFAPLKITDKQRRQFREVVQKMEAKIRPLIKDAETGGRPDEIRPKAMKLRKEHIAQIEGLLTDEQKKQWKALLGKPFDLDEE